MKKEERSYKIWGRFAQGCINLIRESLRDQSRKIWKERDKTKGENFERDFLERIFSKWDEQQERELKKGSK